MRVQRWPNPSDENNAALVHSTFHSFAVFVRARYRVLVRKRSSFATAMKPPINSGNSAVCSIATAVRAHQQAGDFDQAAALLFAHIEQMIERDGWPLARELLARFPTARFDSEPALLYMQGLTCAHADELARAESFLKRAHTFFKQRCAFAEAVRCSLELARVYQRREDFRTAHLLLEETERLLQQVEREQLSAHFFYRLAELYPDIGRLQEGDVQAQQALAHYELQGDLAGQFKTLRLRSIIARQQGRYQEASSYLELAKGLLRTGNFTPAQEALVLNSEAHLLWYSNRLPEALAVAQRLRRHAEQHQITKQQVYAQTLLSNPLPRAGRPCGRGAGVPGAAFARGRADL